MLLSRGYGMDRSPSLARHSCNEIKGCVFSSQRGESNQKELQSEVSIRPRKTETHFL